jgi:hypothetical protein
MMRMFNSWLGSCGLGKTCILDIVAVERSILVLSQLQIIYVFISFFSTSLFLCLVIIIIYIF